MLYLPLALYSWVPFLRTEITILAVRSHCPSDVSQTFFGSLERMYEIRVFEGANRVVAVAVTAIHFGQPLEPGPLRELFIGCRSIWRRFQIFNTLGHPFVEREDIWTSCCDRDTIYHQLLPLKGSELEVLLT